MKPIRLAALLGLLAAAPPALAEPAVTGFRLDNGMEVVVIEDNRAPVVTHMVWYRVGAADDPPGKSGLAHYLEHLMFKGTDTIPEGAFSKIVAENGGQDNAFTSRDFTGYFQRIAADRLEVVMAMEADRMRNLRFSEAVALTERDVILEERNQVVENNVSSQFSEMMSAGLYKHHPYRIPIIGWRHEMEGLTRADALAFYERYYAPDNAILVVAGDVSPEAVRVLAEKHYGPHEPSGRPRAARVQEPPHLAARRVEMQDARVRQPYVVRNWKVPSRLTGDPRDAAALTLLAEVLGGSGVTSRLGRALQLEEGIAISTGAFYSGLSLDATSFGAFVVPAQGVSLADAEAGLERVLARLATEGPTEGELARARIGIEAAEVFAQDSGAGLARRYGSALSMGLSIADVEAWPAMLRGVTAEDVKRVAGLLRPETSVTGWLRGPEPKPQGQQG
jgi:zinc protease